MEDNKEKHPVYDFGWWPEIFGATGVVLLICCLIVFARGSL